MLKFIIFFTNKWGAPNFFLKKILDDTSSNFAQIMGTIVAKTLGLKVFLTQKFIFQLVFFTLNT